MIFQKMPKKCSKKPNYEFLFLQLASLAETFLLIFNHYAIENFTLNLNFSVHVEFGQEYSYHNLARETTRSHLGRKFAPTDRLLPAKEGKARNRNRSPPIPRRNISYHQAMRLGEGRENIKKPREKTFQLPNTITLIWPQKLHSLHFYRIRNSS